MELHLLRALAEAAGRELLSAAARLAVCGLGS